MAVVSQRDGHARNKGTHLIGDRAQIRPLSLDGEAVVVTLVTAGPSDSTCCPTSTVRKTSRLREGNLVEPSFQDLGPFTLADLEGIVWSLERFTQNEELPVGIDITVVFNAGRVSGGSGCNRYFAAVTEPKAGHLNIGLVGSTKMACPPLQMSIEDRDLRVLQQVRGFRFISGQLALTYVEGGITETLFFRALPGRE